MKRRALLFVAAAVPATKPVIQVSVVVYAINCPAAPTCATVVVLLCYYIEIGSDSYTVGFPFLPWQENDTNSCSSGRQANAQVPYYRCWVSVRDPEQQVQQDNANINSTSYQSK